MRESEAKSSQNRWDSKLIKKNVLKTLEKPGRLVFSRVFFSFGYIDDKFYGQQKMGRRMRYFAKIIQNKNKCIDYDHNKHIMKV